MEEAPKSALCVIGLGFYEPWLSILRDGQEQTWLARVRPKNIEVLHVHAIPVSGLGIRLENLHEKIRRRNRYTWFALRVIDSILLFPFRGWVPKIFESKRLSLNDSVKEVAVPDIFPFVRWKELAYFHYFLEKTDHDYLIATTNSSYLNLPLISRAIQDLPIIGLHYGPEPFEGAAFVSGSFRIFSRDVVKAIIDSRRKWDVYHLEDVALGLLVKKLGFKSTLFPIKNIDSLEFIENSDPATLDKFMHIRLKSGTSKKRNDVQLMRALHQRISRGVGM
jgi:hypothetical protein